MCLIELPGYKSENWASVQREAVPDRAREWVHPRLATPLLSGPQLLNQTQEGQGGICGTMQG